MGVDVGLVRVGVALCDPDGILATPLTTLRRDPRKGFDVKLLAGLVQEHDVVAVYVGLPRSLDGGENASTAMARDYAQALVRRLLALLPAGGYVRLQRELGIASDDLDDASPQNLARLREEADALVAERDADIDALCARLAA